MILFSSNSKKAHSNVNKNGKFKEIVIFERFFVIWTRDPWDGTDKTDTVDIDPSRTV